MQALPWHEEDERQDLERHANEKYQRDLRPENVRYTIDDVTKEDVIRSFLTFYRMTKGQ